MGVRDHFFDNDRGLLFKGGVDRRKDRGDSNRLDPLGVDFRRNPANFRRVKGGDFAAIKLVTAVGQVIVAPHHLGQIIGPIDHGRQTDRGWQAQTDTGSRL